jgi:glutamyl-tRNA synthetase
MQEEKLVSSKTSVRVRFAPSPTGFPHVGNIRTALFNWLFARHNNGVFILRIEDTDVARRVDGAVEMIVDSLKWLGIDHDEGPFFQSQRLAMYREIADQLVNEGYAYPCFCSPQRLDEVRKEQTSRKLPPGYDRHCRNLSPDERAKMKASGITPVIRFKIPPDGQTVFNDLIRGDIVFENSTLDDLVLLKSDGYPTYHLANIVDDHSMEISHVLRADEWVSSTPKHVLLYNALKWQPPKFAHLPMILGPDRSKLSKRHGATSINEYRDQGYLPEAMVNFLSLLGWSLDDKTELMDVRQIVENFSLDRVSKTAAVFNKEKLDWMNGVYIRNLSPVDFARKSVPYLEGGLPSTIKRPLDVDYISRMAPLIQDRAKTMAEIPELTDFFFAEELEYDAKLLLNKIETPEAVQALNTTLSALDKMDTWTTDTLEAGIRPLAEQLGLKTGVYFGLIRTAVTGKTATPPLFQTMEVLGKTRCAKRVKAALEKLQLLF